MTGIKDDVRDLYVAHWGEPSRKATFRAAGYEIEIFKWDAEANPEGVAIYATIGSSAYHADGSSIHRVEYFTGLLPPNDAVASPLAALALYPIREGAELDHGHTVPAAGPLWPGTNMRHFLILRPRNEVLPPLVLSEGVHVEFLQAIPLFESELGWKARYGTNALIEHWSKARIPFWDPGRAPCDLPEEFRRSMRGSTQNGST